MTDASINTQADLGEAQFGDYFALLKPRVMTLVVFTALVGLLAAPMPVHPMIGFCAVLFIAVGGGAAGALNMWCGYRRDHAPDPQASDSRWPCRTR